MADHRLASVETDQSDGRTRASCCCKWKSGWKEDHPTAIRALGDHVDRKVDEADRAASGLEGQQRAWAVLSDCAHGLHEEYESVDGCLFPGCKAAYWLLEAVAESVPKG